MISRQINNIINIITLGCSKNIVDSEQLARQLQKNNIKLLFDSDSSDADTVIINTCGFIADAKQESIDTILQFAKAKERGEIKKLYVIGCLSERYMKDLKKEIPDADQYFGVNCIREILNEFNFSYDPEILHERIITTPGHYAYLKISEGCNRLCSFCAIPLIRGKYRSKPVEHIIDEAKYLISKGVKELILIAQDLTYYGTDIYRKNMITELVSRLSGIDGAGWIRLHYAYPAGFPKELISLMKERSNICNYIDIPIQHIHDTVLEKMRRGYTKKQVYDLIHYIRSEIHDIHIRTTLLTGHPGEGEREFNELCDFVKEIEFDRLGVFQYSKEENTYSAIHYTDDADQKIKQYRADTIMGLQREISAKKNTQKIGKELKVIIDRREGDYFIGRTEYDSPEVDNEVLIQYDQSISTGDFIHVMITGSNDYDLTGEK